MDTVHIYPQDCWHDQAYIAGTKGGLRSLRDAIDRALETGFDKCTTFVSDGEGYDIVILPVDEATADKLGLPYTGEMASEKQRDIKEWPWEIARNRALRKEEEK